MISLIIVVQKSGISFGKSKDPARKQGPSREEALLTRCPLFIEMRFSLSSLLREEPLDPVTAVSHRCTMARHGGGSVLVLIACDKMLLAPAAELNCLLQSPVRFV